MFTSVPAILAVLDRVGKLLKRTTTKRKELIDEIVEPIFSEMILIHGDYMKLFERTASMLPTTGGDSQVAQQQLRDAIGYLRESRLELAPIRQKVRHLAEAYSGVKLDLLVDRFTGAVVEYIMSPAGVFSRHERNTPALRMLDSLTCRVEEAELAFRSSEDEEDYDRTQPDPTIADANEMLYLAVRQQEITWQEICRAYAALKANIAQP